MAEGDWLRLSGELVRGHNVASRQSEHYPQGTIEMQAPFFRERGLDVSDYFSGTLNISIAPKTFRIRKAQWHFSAVSWTSKHPAENFSFSPCRVVVSGMSYDGLIYYPHPETKARHHQNDSVIEVLAPFIDGVRYGDRVEVDVLRAEIDVDSTHQGGVMRTQAERGAAFRKLHEGDTAFVIPNPWDIGTARMLAGLGFQALATTSAGFAYSLGQRDNTVPRERVMAHVADIASATDLPVSADLEHGFADDPDSVAETIRLGAAAGLVGGSIEDSTGRRDEPVYALDLAVDRIRAAVEAARTLPFTFTLTARAENHIVGRPDLKDTIRRLQAYQEAGADVLYAPGLVTREDISAVVSSVDRPVNVLMGLPGFQLALSELSEIGVKRISLGSGLTRVAFDAVIRVAREIVEHGTFTYGNEGVSTREIASLFDKALSKN